MNRQLTEEELNELFRICEEREVVYYDLQLEIVDHLASAIEQKWQEEPQLEFHEILTPLIRQFGRYGFLNIVEEKEEALKRKYINLRRRYTLEFFQLPRIILTIAITISLFSLFTILHDYLIVVFVLLILHGILMFVYVYAIFPKKQKIILPEGKTFLLYEQLKSEKYRIISAGNGLMGFFTSFYFFNKEFNVADMNNLPFKLIAAVLIVLTGIMTLVGWFYIPKRMKDDFTREFPQFVKS